MKEKTMSNFITQAEFCAAKIYEQGGDVLAYFEYLFNHRSRNWPKITKAVTLKRILSRHLGQKVSSHRAMEVLRFLHHIRAGIVEDTRLLKSSRFEWLVNSGEIAYHVADRLTDHLDAA